MAVEKERTKDVLIDEANVNFESLFLSSPILQALKENNFFKPSPIQLKAIPLGKCGLDLIVKSKSGTGKTAVFAVISLEMIHTNMDSLQVLILAPTREIAVQSCDVIHTIGKHLEGLKVEHFIGGLPVKEDASKAKGCHIAVGSPGRILHLITSGTLDTSKVKLFVLDEADSLMESNFQADINKIFHHLPRNKQMLAVSATFPHELDKFLAQYMHIPTHVSATMDTPLLLGLKHFVSMTPFNTNVIFLSRFKNAELMRLLQHVSFTQCLIFCNYQTRAEEVTHFLNNNGWTSEFISGAQTQKQRLEVLKRLKEFQCRILLSTDLTARGIDAVNVDLVINYDVPNDESTYLHRMGRAGRYGSKGLCLSIASKGTEVERFESIIGAIGGFEMTVPILPAEKLPENVWDADVASFQQLRGVLKPDNCDKNEIIQSVNKILRDVDETVAEQTLPEVKTPKVKNQKKTKSKRKKVENHKEMNSFKTESLENLDQNEDDTMSLLQSLAAGKNDTTMDAKNTEKDESSIFSKNVSLYTVSGLLDDDNFDVDEDQTKTIESFITSFKESESLSITETCKINENKFVAVENDIINTNIEKVSSLSTSNTNISLLAVSDLLDDDNFDIDDNQTKTVEGFISTLKNAVFDPLEESESSVEKVTPSVDIEDVFKHAFNYAINKAKPYWADLYNYQPVEEEKMETKFNLLQDLLEYCDNDENPEFGDCEDYDDDDCNNYEEYVEEAQEQEYSQPSMEWIPVTDVKAEVVAMHNVPKEMVSSNKVGNEYEGIYEAAVQQLETNFNTLESPKAFDEVWLQWQDQMNAVRDYVQQNIYLSEMSAYRNGLQRK